MKKILSIIAIIGAACYLAAGVGILLFQNTLKNLVMSGDNMITVYPLQNVLQLALLGLPCPILGILSLSETAETKKGMDLLLILYSSIMLVFFAFLIEAGARINAVMVARMQGAAALANMSAVSSFFGYIQFLINLSLVMLLIQGAVSLGQKMYK